MGLSNLTFFRILSALLLPSLTAGSQDLATSIRNNAINIERLDSLNNSVYKALNPFRLIMVGEMHGTNEPAEFVIGLTQLLTANNDSVQVGLEIPEREMGAFLKQGTDSSIYQSEFFSKKPVDGRENRALASVISVLNQNKRVKLFFFANETGFSNPDGAMYLKLKTQILKNPHYKTITLSGNIHNRVKAYKGKETVASSLLADKELKLTNQLCSLNHIYEYGNMINNQGREIELRSVNIPDTVYSSSLESDSYLFLDANTMNGQYTGVLFTRRVTAAKLVVGN